VKGFLAATPTAAWPPRPDDADPTELLEALEGRSAEMAAGLDIFRTAMPEASIWTAEERSVRRPVTAASAIRP